LFLNACRDVMPFGHGALPPVDEEQPSERFRAAIAALAARGEPSNRRKNRLVRTLSPA
jgi:hypothetical protein